MSLLLDSTLLQFQTNYNQICDTTNTDLQLGSSEATGNWTDSSYLYIQNENLHDWYSGDGVIGLSYCQQSSTSSNNCNELTPFQKLVQNASSSGSSSLQFGLDFRNNNSIENKYLYSTTTSDTGSSTNNNTSTMQLGGIDSNYMNSIIWTQQSVQKPSYHQFYLNDLQFCSTEILSNYSTNWPVLIDTGAVCLTLPSEIYDSFSAWFDNTTVIEDTNSLPTFQFQVQNEVNTTTVYVLLSDLIINNTDILSETGAPYINVRNSYGGVEVKRLCVLRGSGISYESSGDTVYYTNAPNIVLGSLALQSLYIGVDYTDYRVGVANKLSETYIASYIHTSGNSGGSNCMRRMNCTGDQTYVSSTNTCRNPQCSRYFFTELNTSTMKCETNASNMVGGLIFVLLVAAAEVVSYIVTQYSAHNILEVNRASASMDPLTKYSGLWLVYAVDVLIVYVLKWVPRRNQNSTVAVAATTTTTTTAASAVRRGNNHNEIEMDLQRVDGNN